MGIGKVGSRADFMLLMITRVAVLAAPILVPLLACKQCGGERQVAGPTVDGSPLGNTRSGTACKQAVARVSQIGGLI